MARRIRMVDGELEISKPTSWSRYGPHSANVGSRHESHSRSNDAALQIVRSSTFSAPVKDGVRVKSWTTVPVDFKL
jgi:hypothetical protein